MIAGSVRWKNRSCCSSPPRTRTFHFASPADSTTNGIPSRRQANVVQSMIVASVLQIRTQPLPLKLPSAS